MFQEDREKNSKSSECREIEGDWLIGVFLNEEYEKVLDYIVLWIRNMTSIAELFPKCRKLAYDARQQLTQVQNGTMHSQDLLCSLDELSNQLDLMNKLVLREAPAQREVWKRKIQELREGSVTIRREADSYDRIVNTNFRHQKERNELLTRRRRRKEYSTMEEQDNLNLADENKSWNQSQYMVNGLIANGETSLNTLIEQRKRMTGVMKFLGQIDDRLGISNSTMKVIERRDITDAYFVMGGCAITCMVIYFTWF